MAKITLSVDVSGLPNDELDAICGLVENKLKEIKGGYSFEANEVDREEDNEDESD